MTQRTILTTRVIEWFHEFLEHLTRRANRTSIGASLLLVIGFQAFIFPRVTPKTSPPLPLPDIHLAYTPKHLAMDLGAWLPFRSSFLVIHLGWDMLYPVIYGAFLAQVLAFLYRPSEERQRPPSWTLTLPLAMVMADWGENLLLALLMVRHPLSSSPLAWLATGCTSLKWGLLGVILGLALGKGMHQTWRRLYTK